MISQFWNLCRACPALDVDKVSCQYFQSVRFIRDIDNINVDITYSCFETSAAAVSTIGIIRHKSFLCKILVFLAMNQFGLMKFCVISSLFMN